MATILALSGCGGRAEVALAAPSLPAPSLVALASPSPRSDLLLRGAAMLLEAAGLGPGELQLVVATRGPGSFTGIRNTLACALGLAAGAGVPAHAFSSLLAQAARCADGEVLAAQPARKGAVYVQAFRWEGAWQPITEPTIRPVAWLASQTLPVVAPAGLALPEGTPLARVRLTTAEALLVLARALQTPDASTLQPLYLEDFPRKEAC